ncbi:M14 family zinc carboxypeptidase [Lederbergia panacisoli]|uniref:M14 family zinc carboxypeptidase n=1 Tax=Lederbergia panacisoli TaxID=1255251 RepID=UPI00214AD1CF|nr:M14 family zinc carboxypeptidase [Lederbergia panacisoli]MCR2821427.1 M14 family zinc carboxypeptidase [Lederbergia panacisoli]
MHKLRTVIIVFVFLLSTFSFNGQPEAAANIVNPNKVYSYDQMVKDIKKLGKTYPDLITYKVIGKSEYGRDIYAVSLGKGPATAFINGAHHGREWITTNLNMYMIEEYAKAYKKNSKIKGYNARNILNSTTIWFVPMVNPDGVTLQQQGLKAFPKSKHASLIKMNKGSTNFKRWKANAKGIDLNRQYNAGWKTIVNSPKGPSYAHFKGYSPASAAEVKAVLKLDAEINAEMAVAYHSSGRILYWNYKQDKATYKRDLVYARAINKLTGYPLVNAGKNPSGGGYTDWFIQAKKRPGFTPEISRPVYESSPPISEFKGAWKENQAVGLYVAQESAKLYDARKKKEAEKLASSFKSLKTKASKLKSSYYTNVKKESDLKITKSFNDLYSSVVKESKKLEAKAAKIPKKHRKQIDSYITSINGYKNYAKSYMDAVNAGNALVTSTKSLDKLFVDGKLNSTTISKQKQLIKSTTAAEKKVNKMYGKTPRSLAKKKYITPASILTKNVQYEIDRYNLTLQIEKDVNMKKIDTAKANLAKLTKLEASSKKAKTDGNKKYPGKYKTYKKTEDLLKKMKAKVEASIKKLEKELEPKEEPVDEETPVEENTK